MRCFSMRELQNCLNYCYTLNLSTAMFVKDLEASELAVLLDTPQPPLLLDVRTPGEIAAGIIPHAQAMPLTVLPLRIQDIPRDQQVVIYCRTGARSAQACMFLGQYGFDNVYNLRGGIITWAQNGLPITPSPRLA
jgi:rhodanese-related sulfurtransferase